MSDAAMPEPEWLDVNEAMALLHISRATLYRLVKRGDIVASRLGGRLQFKRADVLAARKPVTPPSTT